MGIQQGRTATSTGPIHAEYVVPWRSSAVEVIWLRMLLKEIGYRVSHQGANDHIRDGRQGNANGLVSQLFAFESTCRNPSL